MDKVRNGHNIQLPNKVADSDNTGPNKAAYLSRTGCMAGHSKSMWRSSQERACHIASSGAEPEHCHGAYPRHLGG